MSTQGFPASQLAASYLPQLFVWGQQAIANGIYPPAANFPVFQNTPWRDDGYFTIPGDLTAVGIRDAGRYELTLVAAEGQSDSDFYVEGGPNGQFNVVWRQVPVAIGVPWQVSFTDYFDAAAGDVWRFRVYHEPGATITVTLNAIFVRIG